MDSRTRLLCYSLQNITSSVFWTAVMLLCTKPAQLNGGPVLQPAPHAEKASLVGSRTELEEAETDTCPMGAHPFCQAQPSSFACKGLE